MADGDHYAAYADVQNACMNASIGVSATMYSTAALELALDITMANIHLELGGITTKISTEPYATVLKGIQIDVTKQMILHARLFNENNLVDVNVIKTVADGIRFSDEHLRQLEKIMRFANKSG